jgi:hypothetical protein
MGLLLTVVVTGCGGEGGGSVQPGALSVSLTDAPACGYDEVNVTVDKVRVHRSSAVDETAADWTTIALVPPRKINLLGLNDPTQPNFALDRLGETPLDAGHYTQLRLVLSPNRNGSPLANSIVLSGTTTEIALETPSAVQSGIKLIHQFTVSSGQRVDLLLDFDACKSIVKTGNNKYKLKPVIQVIPIELNGIEGFVDPALFVNQVNVHHVSVSAQVNGEIIRATMPNVTTGKFFLARLAAPANYNVVLTADDRATKVIAGVPVASSTGITTISTTGEPITLQPSTTQSISGTVTLNPATDDHTVFLAAKQTLSSGLFVTVNSRTASVVEGDPAGDFSYALTLPVAAPSLGQYSTPLPITFILQPATVAGHYAVQASATGYIAQSFDQDISLGNASQDFTLIP